MGTLPKKMEKQERKSSLFIFNDFSFLYCASIAKLWSTVSFAGFEMVPGNFEIRV